MKISKNKRLETFVCDKCNKTFTSLFEEFWDWDLIGSETHTEFAHCPFCEHNNKINLSKKKYKHLKKAPSTEKR